MTALTLADCEARDRTDPLAPLREQFLLTPGRIYLDGNSLGLLTRAARERIRATVEDEWGVDAIKGWHTRDWMGLPDRVGARIARLIGARADEVTVADSTSINLFKLAASCLRAGNGSRRKIVTELGNFSTDVYVLQGLRDLLGPQVQLCAVPREEVVAAIDRDTALVVLTHVHYKTSELFDLAEITRHAHAQGASMLWDLSHSVGALPVHLNAARVDFAIGCTYKYLNGGPGAPAFLYVRKDLQEQLPAGIAGWLGHSKPFDFCDDFEPAAGMRRHHCGTPGILGQASLDGSLSVFDQVDMQAVRQKSLQLTQLFIDLVEQECAGHGLSVVTPRSPERRGSHVSLRHEHGYEIMQALIAREVIGDFRAPDVVRFGFTPLYTSYVDCWHAVSRLRDVLESGSWQVADYRVRRAVT
jgi:kynureninase